MNKQYDLTFGGRSVGKVEVAQEGLYYRFCCRCRLSGDVICRAILEHGGKRESLGILVPVGDGFGSTARIPAKRIADGQWQFAVVPNRDRDEKKYVPIKPEEPFAYIARLKDAYLALHQGQACAVVADTM